MNHKTTKTFIFKKTAVIGVVKIFGTILAFVREFLQACYLGINGDSDAFITAFRLPNMLRKLYEGNGLTAAIVPHTVKMLHDGRTEEVNQVSLTIFGVIECIMVMFCFLVWIFPESAIGFIAPGFSVDQIVAAVPVVKVMYPVIIGFAGFSVLSTFINAINHFFIPALGPLVFHVVYIVGLKYCLAWSLPIKTMAGFVVLAGFIKFLLVFAAYFFYGFSFSFPQKNVWSDLKIIFRQMLPCLVSFGALEVDSFLDIRFGSYLPKGCITMLYLTHRLYMVPYSIFAASLGTVLLSHFSESIIKNPKRLRFYLLESSKLATWFALPVCIFMVCFSGFFFTPELFKGRATPELIVLSGKILAIMACAFPFQILNKIMLKSLLSLRDSDSSTLVVVLATIVGAAFNYYTIGFLGAFAMAYATVLRAAIKTLGLMGLLFFKHNIVWPLDPYFNFLKAYGFQFFWGVCFFGFLYATLTQIIQTILAAQCMQLGQLEHFFLVLAVFVITLFFMWRTYKYFGLRMYLMPYHTKH
ncbi:hypothetical protein FJ366_01970 [Candidatus Dependentiae bacterium]|nr:hypothetical protein [Candidatus Dependentiae bacterium]